LRRCNRIRNFRANTAGNGALGSDAKLGDVAIVGNPEGPIDAPPTGTPLARSNGLNN
jgi:hypothetical protein